MENRGRILRTNSCCPSTDNIFNFLTGNPHLLQKIPPHVLRLAASSKLISCTTIQTLPELKLPVYSSEDIRKLTEAANYQVQWQAELCQCEIPLSDKPTQTEEEKMSEEKAADNCAVEKAWEAGKGGLVEEESCLYQLQEFIVSDTYEDRTLNLLEFWG